MAKLFHIETEHEIDTKGMDASEYHQRIAAGYVTKEQLSARKAADKEAAADLKAADKYDPAVSAPPPVVN